MSGQPASVGLAITTAGRRVRRRRLRGQPPQLSFKEADLQIEVSGQMFAYLRDGDHSLKRLVVVAWR